MDAGLEIEPLNLCLHRSMLKVYEQEKFIAAWKASQLSMYIHCYRLFKRYGWYRGGMISYYKRYGWYGWDVVSYYKSYGWYAWDMVSYYKRYGWNMAIIKDMDDIGETW